MFDFITDIAQGCTGSQLSLACEETKVIQIISVVLGDSDCIGTSCCIKHSDCTRNANSNHRKNVHHRCDNKQSCTVRILTEAITCGVWGTRSDNDFERITYICVNETQSKLTVLRCRMLYSEVTLFLVVILAIA